MGLLEGATQTLVVEDLVALEVDLADLDALTTVDLEDYVGILCAYRVLLNAVVYLGVAETLFAPVLFDQAHILIQHIVRKLAVATQLELLHDILLLAGRDALELPVEDTGTLLEEDLQVEAVALDLGAHLHVGEVALTPQTGDDIRDEVARQQNRIAIHQAGRSLHQVGIQVLQTTHVDLADVVLLLLTALGAEHRGILVKIGFDLCAVGRFCDSLLGRCGAKQRHKRHCQDQYVA